jgi:hypothetical protein
MTEIGPFALLAIVAFVRAPFLPGDVQPIVWGFAALMVFTCITLAVALWWSLKRARPQSAPLRDPAVE